MTPKPSRKPVEPDAYSASRPDKAEYFLSRMNIHCMDPSLPVGGTSAPTITAGEIAAAVAMSPPGLPVTCKYVSRESALAMLHEFLFAKYAMDQAATRQLFYWVFGNIAPGVLISLESDQKKLSEEIRQNRGVLRRMCEVAIDDIMRPHLYLDLSARTWASKLGLANHKQWQGRWKSRYEEVMDVLQELDAVIARQIEKKI